MLAAAKLTRQAESPVEAEVRRIRELLESGAHLDALKASESLALQVPENRDVLYMMAVSQRYLNRTGDALQTLDRLGRLHPQFSRVHQERGHCFMASRDAPKAVQAFLTAVNRNPALPASWSRLELLYRMAGDASNAANAAEHVRTLKSLSSEVIAATALFCDGDLGVAEAVIRPYLLKNTVDVEAMRLLARIAIARGVLEDAEVLLGAVLELAPGYNKARFEYASTLLDRHKHTSALKELAHLLSLEPGNREYKTLYATVHVGVGDHEKALQLYRELLEDAPRKSELYLSIAHSLKTMGKREDAILAYRAAAADRPNFGDAYWSLANLKTYRFEDAELERMMAQEALDATLSVDRYHLCFALGKAFEDRGAYQRSYKYYERGNALKKGESPYQAVHVERNTRLQIEVCTREFFAAHTGVGARDPDPIFIVGLPRSGSTLLEQILASHTRIEGTHELADIARTVHEIQGREPQSGEPCYPRILRELSPEQYLRLGERYLHDTRAYRTGKPYFIDKMPNNFRHIGLIHLMLPNAKIIDARREPMACCFSNLKQLFASGQEFTYGVEDIARYYRTYLELMRHWHGALPGRILTVMHEEVVDNLEGHVRRLLQFCGLEFEPACLNFHLTQRSVRTASSEQVRQPLFRDGLEQWKHFEPWLEPLKAALGDATHRYRELT